MFPAKKVLARVIKNINKLGESKEQNAGILSGVLLYPR